MSVVSPIHRANPREVRVEACIGCQLNCPGCTTILNEKQDYLG